MDPATGDCHRTGSHASGSARNRGATRSRGDAALVATARTGDKDAFAALVDRHRSMALTLVARLLGNDDAAADAVQEAALAALVSIQRLRDPERFGPWFAGIALNVARRWRREAVAFIPTALERPSEGAAPDEAAEAAAVAREVQDAVATLAPGQRDAVLAFYWGDRSHLEAAAQLGITTGAVKARLHQARANLLPQLAHHATGLRSSTSKEATMTTPAPARTGTPAWVRAHVADVRRSVDDDPARRLHVIVLGEVGGNRRLPIYVGAAEATALACTLESVETPRPLTYAMAAGLVRASGARVTEVRITKLAESVFYALVALDGPGGPDAVDARPSDALNLALVCEVPVLVEEALFADDGPRDGWRTVWQGFPSAASTIATEVRERDANLEALRCERGASPGT
jgi:RNA polymerase sigma factor (sigma-70 family)